MAAKVFFLFFTLFATVFAQVPSLPGLPTLPDIRDSIDDSMKRLMNDSQTATTLATTASTLAAALRTNIDARLEDASSKVAAVMGEVRQQAQAALQESGGDVNKLLACAQEQQTDLEAFQNATLANLTGCITDKANEASNLEAKLLDPSQIISTIVTEIGDQIQSRCPIPANGTAISAVTQAFCTVKVIAYAEGVVAKQSAIISSNIAAGTALVDSLSTLQADLATCFTTRASAAALASRPIIDAIVACTTA